MESFEVDQELWVVMEYMSCGSVFDIVKHYNQSPSFRMSEELCAYIIREILQGLDFLHKKKRIHRDIKVDNILLSKDGKVKLADFGTAVQLTFERLRRNTLAGTPYYMAPELIQRKPYGEKVDIWSIGISVVEIITGNPPYYSLDPHSALDAIVTHGVTGLDQDAGSAKKYSAEILDFVNCQCLCPSPELRASAEELLAHPYVYRAVTQDQFAKYLRSLSVQDQLDDVLGVNGGSSSSSYQGGGDSGCTIL